MIQITIHCKKDGTLRSLLTKEDILNTQSIIITGKVNNDDFSLLTTMTKDYSLSEIDMENAFAEKTNQIYFQFGRNIKKIKLPHYLEKINQSAFSDTQLSTISIPSSVYEIGTEAFKNTLLENVFIPASVRKIGQKAFASTALKKVEIASSNINIEKGTFIDCGNLCEIYLHIKNPPAIIISNNFPFIATFDATLPEKCTIYIPKGSKETYEKSDVWIKFEKFVEKEYSPHTEIIEKDYIGEVIAKKENKKKRNAFGGCLMYLIVGGIILYVILRNI